MAANLLQAAGGAIVSNPGKEAAVGSAVASLDAQGWTCFGLDSQGGERRNKMSIGKGTKHNIELEKMYIHWGKIKIPPEA